MTDGRGTMTNALPAEFEFDGAEGIAFWVTNPRNEESAPVLFDDLDRLDDFLREWFPGRYHD